jgi:lipopolysaccharide transport system ATP-binding protein
MALMTLESINLIYPVYTNISMKSFKHSLLNTLTGGYLYNDLNNIVHVHALRDINLEIYDGDIVGFIGQNGSGKTSLLQLLSKIYHPTSGVYVSEGSISSLLSITIGMDPEFTGYENINLRCKLLGLSNYEINNLIPKIAEFTELGDFLKLPIKTYSSGMLMRLAFSIVTSIKSDIVIMDEWLSVGDSDFKEKISIRFDDFLSNSQIIIVASHDLEFINKKCNRIYKLDKGNIIKIK